uniref:Pol-like protein n=1 Tax=Hirondellea gigas TaxID=1518452 RepID=A0A6A7FMS9_9CRUS
MWALESSILGAANNSIKICEGSASPKYCKYWWTKACHDATRAKKKAFNRYKRHLGDIDLWIDYKKARAVQRKIIVEARAESWNKYVESINSRTTSADVWRKVKSINGSTAFSHVALKINDKVVVDNAEIADIFAVQFSRASNGIYNNHDFNTLKVASEKIPIIFSDNNDHWYNRSLEYRELDRALKSCNSKTPGPDFIPFDFLINMSDNQKMQLLQFYNYIWNTGLPHQWRECIIFPLLKPGKSSADPLSYRPIALTNCMCKVLEKIINWRLQAFLEHNILVTPCQSGFRAGHSTMDALTRLESAVRECLIRDDFCVAVFLDIASAFDKVWHYGLLMKIKQMGLEGNLPRFVQKILSMRKLAVRVNGHVSERYPVHSGTPQGSIISPTLFSIMINDIFDSCPAGVHYSLYADDGAFWTSGASLLDCLTLLQDVLDSVQNWSGLWGLEVAPAKTKAIIFTRKRKYNPITLSICNNSIEYVSSFKFLGMVLDKKLSWNFHIAKLKEKCQKDLRLLAIVASNRWGANFSTLKRLYIGLTRPKLEYGGFLLETASISNLKILDRIQYAAVRTMLGALRCTNTKILESEANIMPLALRRKLFLVKYACRTLSIPNHPVANITKNYYHFGFFQDSNQELPSVGRIYCQFVNLQLKYNQIATVPVECRYVTYCVPCYFSLCKNKKSDLDANGWCALFGDLRDSDYSDRIDVYCDGSVRGGVAGCGVWSSSFCIKSRLADDSSIFTAELYAIYYTLQFIRDKVGIFVVFSDSYSALCALSSFKVSNNYLVSRIRELLLNLGSSKVVIEWIPSHMGIHGNDNADALARESLALPYLGNAFLPLDDIYRHMYKHYLELWQQQWSASGLPYRSMKPVLCDTVPAHLSRSHQKVFTRLRLGVCLLTHGHHFTKSVRAECAACCCRMTIGHLLVDCPALSKLREPLMQKCISLKTTLTVQRLLDGEFPQDMLMHFLKVTGFIDKI